MSKHKKSNIYSNSQKIETYYCIEKYNAMIKGTINKHIKKWQMYKPSAQPNSINEDISNVNN